VAAIHGIPRQLLGQRHSFRLRLSDALAAAALACRGLLALASLAQLGDKGLLFELGDGA
jgi:hypothetical protein